MKTRRQSLAAALMSNVSIAAAILVSSAAGAGAGPNAGGMIFVHYAPMSVPSGPTYVDGGLTDCADAVVQAPADETILWFAYAAFPPASCPRLKVVTFGCEFNHPGVEVLWSATLPGAIQIFYPDQAAWPYTGSGTAVGFLETLTAIVDEIYCFAGYGAVGEYFRLVTHPDPVIGGAFVDDTVVGGMDIIAGYGSLGFGTYGVPACPGPPPTGACCLSDGRCTIALPCPCWEAGGLYVGDDAECLPDPCTPGACCLPDGRCLIASEASCLDLDGRWGGGPCLSSSCTTPTERATWGRIKSAYRE